MEAQQQRCARAAVAAAADEAQKEVKDCCQDHVAGGCRKSILWTTGIPWEWNIGIPFEYNWTHVDTVDINGYSDSWRRVADQETDQPIKKIK